MPKHAEPNQREQSSAGARNALTSLVRLLAHQAAREALATLPIDYSKNGGRGTAVSSPSTSCTPADPYNAEAD